MTDNRILEYERDEARGELRLMPMLVQSKDRIRSSMQPRYPFKAYVLQVSRKVAECFNNFQVRVGVFEQKVNMIAADDLTKIPAELSEVIQEARTLLQSGFMRAGDIGYDVCLPQVMMEVRADNTSDASVLFEGSFFGLYVMPDGTFSPKVEPMPLKES